MVRRQSSYHIAIAILLLSLLFQPCCAFLPSSVHISSVAQKRQRTPREVFDVMSGVGRWQNFGRSDSTVGYYNRRATGAAHSTSPSSDSRNVTSNLREAPGEGEGDVVDDPSSTLTVSTIIRFAIPAIGIWLCSPLLSVIDTAAVGLISGTVQQAALNPSVAITDFSVQCMAFLFTGTTNLISITYDKEKNMQEKTEVRRTLLSALRLSLRVGVGFCLFLLLFTTPLLRMMVGRGMSNVEVMNSAKRYVQIRSLGMPAAALIGTAQAACLGMKDVRSPLLVTLLAAVVNLVADIILVRNPNPIIGGTAGAAWATILSQYISVIAYFAFLRGRSFQGIRRPFGLLANSTSSTVLGMSQALGWSKKALDNVKESEANGQKLGKDEQGSAARGILRGMRIRSLLALENRTDQVGKTADFAPFVVPVTTTQIGRCSVYVAIGNVVSGLGAVSMAANQILNSFFYALIPIADALGQTAQALLPPIFAVTDSAMTDTTDKLEREKNMLNLERALKSFLKAALMCGGVLTSIVAGIPWITRTWMTSDAIVAQAVNTVVPIYLKIFMLHGIFCASEGILLAQKDLKYLGRMYFMYFAVVPALLLQLKRFGSQLQLQTVWACFLAYQLFRITAWVGRVLWLFFKQKRTLTNQARSDLR